MRACCLAAGAHRTWPWSNPKEGGGVSDLLTAAIVERAIGLRRYAKRFDRLEVSQFQRALRADRDPVQHRANLVWERGLAAEVEMDFLQRPLWRKGSVEHIEGSQIPSRGGGVSLKDITLFTHDAPDIAVETYAGMGIERVE